MKHLFIIDHINKLNPLLDTSLKLARSLFNLNHEIYFAFKGGLFWQHGKKTAQAQCWICEDWGSDGLPRQKGHLITLDLGEFSSIQMRLEPPVDSQYLLTTLILESVGKNSVYNSPCALRKYNEKLSCFLYPFSYNYDIILA